MHPTIGSVAAAAACWDDSYWVLHLYYCCKEPLMEVYVQAQLLAAAPLPPLPPPLLAMAQDIGFVHTTEDMFIYNKY